MMSRLSSGLPIFALSRNADTLQRLALCRGVIPLFFDFTAFAPQDLEARTIEFLGGRWLPGSRRLHPAHDGKRAWRIG
jgi:pyruvate kinase